MILSRNNKSYRRGRSVYPSKLINKYFLSQNLESILFFSTFVCPNNCVHGHRTKSFTQHKLTDSIEAMKILVLNCGSSSIKYQLIDMSKEYELLAKGLLDRIGLE